MEKAGHLVFAGPLSDDSGDNWSGAGLIVYRAASLDAARALAAADPMHASGCRTFILRRWLLNEGQLRLERDETRFDHLMESNPFALAGAVRSTMWFIGQAPQRTRRADLAHRRPVFRAR